MRIFHQLLNEGLIQHIDRLKTQVRDFVINSTITKMLTTVDELPDSQRAVGYLKQYAFGYYPNLQLTDITSRTFRRPQLNEVPVQYRKFYPHALDYWASTGPLRVTCYYSRSKFGMSGGGYYDPNSNLIAINCSNIVERDYQSFVDAVNTNNEQKSQALAIRLTGSVMNQVATALHELIHYMQDSFVGHGHPQQQKMGKAAEEDRTSYWTSNVEVPAQIQGFVVRSRAWVLEYKLYYPKLTFVDFGRYAVGDIDSGELAKLSGVKEKLIPISLPAREFFLDLKRTRPSMYQRAVKYFMGKMHE